MNKDKEKEIRRILDFLKKPLKNKILKALNEKDAILLLDYITGLQQRIDKAIEYLKEREEDNMCCSVCSVMSDKLLEILGDKENE